MYFTSFRSVVSVVSAGVVLWAYSSAFHPAAAATLEAPKGEVLLTVTGNLETTNADGAAAFDLEMLEALPKTEFSTTTVWTEGMQDFEGVSLQTLSELLGVEGENLHATAVNDYGINIPTDSIAKDGPIVAYRMNGKTMSLRDKGPLWIVYPYDSSPDLRSEVIYSRSIWQLDRIEAQD